MKLRALLLVTTLAAAFASTILAQEDESTRPRWRDPEADVQIVDAEVTAALQAAFDGTSIPGAVGGIADREGGIRVGAIGVRKVDDDTAMTVDDLVHIGSDTKAMTSVLVARLVEKGLLKWDSTIADVLPGLAEEIDEGFRGVTITQLLRHTSGAPRNTSWRAFGDLELRERRLRLAARALSKPPKTTPGEAYLYSNLGYMVAGAMAEAAADATWEELMAREVFEPLGMDAVGFGPPGTVGEVDQPWGHRVQGERVRSSQIDNAEALGPAGTVHLSLESWARFVLEFTDAAGRDEGFLTAASREKLVEVGRNGYAYGWMVTKRPWAKGVALAHSGSNTTWYATAWVAPRTNRAYLVAVNAAGDGVDASVDGAVGALIRLDASRSAEGSGR